MYDAIDLPDDTRALRELTARLCADHQMPLEERILNGEKLTRADSDPGLVAAQEAGLWGLSLSEEYGGANLSTFDLVAVTEIASRPVAELRFGGNVPASLLGATGEQKERFTDPLLAGDLKYCFAQTEPTGGADPGGSLRTRAVRDGHEWVINGNKVFISNVADADLCLVVAVTDGELRQRGGISMFVVDMRNPGLKVARAIEVLGGMVVHELFFDDCRVPSYALLGGEGGGFREAQLLLTRARMCVGANGLGIAGRALEMMTAYAKERTLFGSALADKQVIQGFIADSWLEIHQARLAMFNTARRTDEGKDTRMEASMVKMLGTEVAQKVVDRAIQVYGAAGTSLDNPLAHWYAKVRLSRLYEGPTEVHKYHVIAKRLLKD